MKSIKILCFLFITLTMPSAFSGSIAVGGKTIKSVVVNGGIDTANPGTSCIQVTGAISVACPGNYIAIPNNNQQLLSAALTAKATGKKSWIYYIDDSPTNLHCPGLYFTPCSLISISVQ
jgi:hypothetical protein